MISIIRDGMQFQSTLPARGATAAGGASHEYYHDFNPRSPRGERLMPVIMWALSLANFNPRSPRGERLGVGKYRDVLADFNPRSPRGERLWQKNCILFWSRISIHAPREGSDFCARASRADSLISIHAPREGSDLFFFARLTFARNFNPRSPRGERRRGAPSFARQGDFNPRSPRGERLETMPSAYKAF